MSDLWPTVAFAALRQSCDEARLVYRVETTDADTRQALGYVEAE